MKKSLFNSRLTVIKRLKIAYYFLKTRGAVASFATLQKRVKGSAYWRDYESLNNPLYDISESDLKNNQQILASYKSTAQSLVESITWFLPYTEGYTMGGRNTIYNLATFLEIHKGVQNHYAIWADTNTSLNSGIKMLCGHVPNVSKENVSMITNIKDIQNLQPTDIGIATKWNTAYMLLRFNQTKRKFYFVQDFEPSFYQAGMHYAIAEATYRFGFNGIVSTQGLEEEYAAYSKKHMSFTPAIDSSIYYKANKNKSKKSPIRIIFYGRPSSSRNGFLLGIEALKRVKQKYGTRVDIFSVGEKWEPSYYGVDGVIKNLGLLKSLQEVGNLYRNVDIGFGLIFTKHTSYQPFEYMASGAAVVMNHNRFTGWFLKDGKNCLLAEPSISDIAAKIGRLIEDPHLLKQLQEAGIESIKSNTWEMQFEHVWDFIQKN